MVTIDWHRVACIAHFVTFSHIFFDDNSYSVIDMNTLKHLIHERLCCWKSPVYVTGGLDVQVVVDLRQTFNLSCGFLQQLVVQHGV